MKTHHTSKTAAPKQTRETPSAVLQPPGSALPEGTHRDFAPTQPEPAAVLSREEELQLFRRLISCRKRHLALALQSGGGLAEFVRLCKERESLNSANSSTDETRRRATCSKRLRRLQREALPLWRLLQTGAVPAAENDGEVCAELQRNREHILEALCASGISLDLRHRVTASALASLTDAKVQKETPSHTALLTRWLRQVEREIAAIEAHIVAANQGLVCVVVKRYADLGLTLADLIQEGKHRAASSD